MLFKAATLAVPPILKNTFMVGPLPDHIAWNSDCTMIATANEGEGVYDSSLVRSGNWLFTLPPL